MKILRPLLILVIIFSAALMLAVSLHSVEEIHYLKTFFPKSFTVEEAFYAAGVELIKVHIISLPLIVIIVLCLLAWRLYRER